MSLPVVDAHFDLAENVTLFGRDLTLPLAEIRACEDRATNQATVSPPEPAGFPSPRLAAGCMRACA